MTADAVGGVWQYCVDLIAGLSRRNISVTVATMGPRPHSQQRQSLLSIPGTTLIESDWALEWMQSPWADVESAGEWLLGLQQKHGFDLIHLNGFAHAAMPWHKPVVSVAHSCVCSWWRAVYGVAAGPDWATYKDRVSRGLQASVRIIAPSASMSKSIESEYAISSEKVQVIHNFTCIGRSENPPKELFVLAAGRFWDKAKNLALLAQIAPHLRWPVSVAGSTESLDGADAPHSGSVNFLGPLPHNELINQMRRAAIYIHPALYEPFGLSVLEAARVGCCLVLSDIPSLRELWEGAAIFVDARNPREWVQTINFLSHDAEARSTLGRLAQKRSGRYRLGSAVNSYCKLYKELIDQSHAQSEAAA